MTDSTSADTLVVAVIVNYETTRLAKECAKSLFRAGVDRVVIWDNASPSGIEPLATWALKNSNIELVRGQENLGFGVGVNRAVAEALKRDDVTHLWIVNPDVLVPNWALGPLLDAAREGWDLLSPVIETGDKTAPTVWFAGGEVRPEAGVCLPWIAPIDPRAVLASSFITGAATFMTRRAWDTLGGYREDLFMYWEDADLSLRAAASGLRVGVVGGSTVWHEVGGSQGDPGKSRLYFHYMARNRILVCASFASRTSIVFGRGARYTARLLRTASGEDQARCAKLCEVVRGTLAGLVSASGPLR